MTLELNGCDGSLTAEVGRVISLTNLRAVARVSDAGSQGAPLAISQERVAIVGWLGPSRQGGRWADKASEGAGANVRRPLPGCVQPTRWDNAVHPPTPLWALWEGGGVGEAERETPLF